MEFSQPETGMPMAASEAAGSLCEMAVICNQRGLHARAAAKFVKTAMHFACDITVVKAEMSVSGRSIMGLMMLAASTGTLLKVCANGTDAVAALSALTDLIKRGFDEN
jgi:phosphocarrier protein HPr